MAAKRGLADAEGSKLSRAGSQSGELAGLTSSNAVPARNKTVRLYAHDLGRLRDLTERLGMMTGRRVSEADVMRAALLLAEKAEPGLGGCERQRALRGDSSQERGW